MSNWRRWKEGLGWFLLAVLFAWNASLGVPTGVKRIYCFAMIIAVVLVGAVLSHFRGRRFVMMKICYVVVAILLFKYLNVGFSRNDIAFTIFNAGIVSTLAFLPPIPQRTGFKLSLWWPAMKRTIRRLRGDWRADEERFAKETTNKSQ
jgi:hypothetical protein